MASGRVPVTGAFGLSCQLRPIVQAPFPVTLFFEDGFQDFGFAIPLGKDA